MSDVLRTLEIIDIYSRHYFKNFKQFIRANRSLLPTSVHTSFNNGANHQFLITEKPPSPSCERSLSAEGQLYAYSPTFINIFSFSVAIALAQWLEKQPDGATLEEIQQQFAEVPSDLMGIDLDDVRAYLPLPNSLTITAISSFLDKN